jgi:hypothetical protein
MGTVGLLIGAAAVEDASVRTLGVDLAASPATTAA